MSAELSEQEIVVLRMIAKCTPANDYPSELFDVALGMTVPRMKLAESVTPVVGYSVVGQQFFRPTDAGWIVLALLDQLEKERKEAREQETQK